MVTVMAVVIVTVVHTSICFSKKKSHDHGDLLSNMLSEEEE
jgi:hypothetical protein